MGAGSSSGMMQSDFVVVDFLHRHGKAIRRAIAKQPFEHHSRCKSGKVIWHWSWRFPFLRIYRSRSICVCEINYLLRVGKVVRKKCGCLSKHCICEILKILDTLAD